jgi:hypothetical protein
MGRDREGTAGVARLAVPAVVVEGASQIQIRFRG